jgi:hypothetical protein
VILAALVLAALADNDPAGAAVLMQQVARQSETLARARSERGLTYTKELIIHDVEDEQYPVREASKTWTVRAVGTGTVSRLLTEDGTSTPNSPEKPDFDFLEAMRTKYRFRWAPEPETVDEHGRCFNIEFEPLSDNADADSDEERVANNLTGTACIDVDGFFVRRIDAHLFRQFKVRFGVRMKRARITIEQHLVEGVPVYLRSRTELHYAVFGFDSVKCHDIAYRDWKFQIAAPAPTP